MNISNWKVARSGSTMTVTGIDAASGEPVKLAQVTSIGVNDKSGVIEANQRITQVIGMETRYSRHVLLPGKSRAEMAKDEAAFRSAVASGACGIQKTN